MIIKKIIIFLFLLQGVVYASSYTISNVPNPKKNGKSGFVSNPDGILKESTVLQLNEISTSLETETSAELAIVILQSIGNESIKSFAVKLFEKWGIGKKEIDNGLLILFVMDQRSITFETGYGLEGILPDAICKRIQEQIMLPEFRKEDYDTGFLNGAKYISAIIRDEPVPEFITSNFYSTNLLIFLVYLLLIIYPFPFIYKITNEIKESKEFTTNHARESEFIKKSAPFLAINFLLFLALLFLVLIAFPSWKNFLLTLPVLLMSVPSSIYGTKRLQRIIIPKCKTCKQKMIQIAKNKEQEYLEPAQLKEKELNSVHFEVFKCKKCSNIIVQSSINYIANYIECPECKTHAYYKDTFGKTIKEATFKKKGIRRMTSHCKFCNYESIYDREIPYKTKYDYIDKAEKSNPSSSLTTSYNNKSNYTNTKTKSNYNTISESKPSNSPDTSTSSTNRSFGGGRSGGGGATSSW